MVETKSTTEAVVALGEAVRANTLTAADGGVSVHFFRVVKAPDSVLTRDELISMIRDAEHGFYGDLTIDRLKAGPSYIELGAWIGDQGLAMQLMGLGELLELWTVVTPASLGAEGKQADDLAGMGFVMIAPAQALLVAVK